MLSSELFSLVIKNTPLISIDLIVKNSMDEVLLGKRVNQPAKNYWFVPGGRIFKGETVNEAFSRICRDELDLDLAMKDAEFYGIYEHFYNNNAFNTEFSTHYVVLAYNITLKNKFTFPNAQHSDYLWTNSNNLLILDDVHQYTKDYFRGK